MTVAELIELLTTYPPTMEVDLEGCDCVNAAAGAQLSSKFYHNPIYRPRVERLILTLDGEPSEDAQ